MSNYIDWAINPKNGKIERAHFIDDCFGKHKYGVQFFESDPKVYRIEEVMIPTEEQVKKSRAFKEWQKKGYTQPIEVMSPQVVNSTPMFLVDEDTIVYAFRYTLPRHTGAVRDMVETLRQHWDYLRPFTQKQIQEEIESERELHDNSERWNEVLSWEVKNNKEEWEIKR